MADEQYDDVVVSRKRFPCREPRARHEEYERAKAGNPDFLVEKNARERARWRRDNPKKPQHVAKTIFYKGPVVSRQEAIKAGKTKYFTGRACRFGHVDEWVVSGGCGHCRRVRLSRKEKGKNLDHLDEASVRPRTSVCDICAKKVDRIVLDHCHGTGKFRGWLCEKCNFCLGLASDDPSLLKKMARYLERNGKALDQVSDQASWSFAPSLACCGRGENPRQEDG